MHESLRLAKLFGIELALILRRFKPRASLASTNSLALLVSSLANALQRAPQGLIEAGWWH